MAAWWVTRLQGMSRASGSVVVDSVKVMLAT